MNTFELKEERLLARKAKESTKVDAINSVLTTIETIELRNNKTLSDDEVMNAIKKTVCELEETYEMYNDGYHGNELSECCLKLSHLQRYLPADMTGAEIESAVVSAIEAVGAETMRDMGKVMGALQKYGVELNKGKASKIVKERLSQ